MSSGKIDISQVNSCTTTIKIISWLSKVYSGIKTKKSGKQNVDQEVETLMKLCLSENPHVNLLACQILVKTAEDDLLLFSQVRTILLSMLPNAEGSRFAAVSEGIFDLLVLELKKQSQASRKKDSKDKYNCPYGLQHPEHPFIAILNAKQGHGQEIAVKIKELVNHQDRDISQASVEFLRPVFLYVVKNMEKIPSARTLWGLLVAQTIKSDQGEQLFLDCLLWISCEKSTLLSNVLLNDALEAMIPKKKHRITANVALILAASLSNQLKLGLDPRSSFSLILRMLQNEQCSGIVPQGVLLLICIQLLEEISPKYLEELLKLIKQLMLNYKGNRFLMQHMLLDSLLLWSGEENLISGIAKKEMELLKELIEKEKEKEDSLSEVLQNPISKFLDRTVALHHKFDGICSRIESDFPGIFQVETFTDIVKNPLAMKLYSKILRGILLCHRLISPENCQDTINALKIVLRENEEISIKFLLVFQKEVKNIKDRSKKLEIVRGIVECGYHRTNIQAILGTIRTFSEDKGGKFNGDILKLYLRLWQVDSRTYQYLFDQLARARGNPDEELNLARAEAIKEICEQNPGQHGADLVSHLSDVLNQCSSPSDDGSVICIVLETILLLCQSRTVSIVAIWKALGFIFRYEKRSNVTKSLCDFFGHLPNYPSNSPEYDTMVREVYNRLWSIGLNKSLQKEVRKAAFDALAKFPLEKIDLKQLPEQFRHNLKLPKSKLGPDKDPLDSLSYIPGECWMQMLQKIDKEACSFAGDLTAELIRSEIREYRGGVYNVPAGKSEPDNLSYLPHKSILRPIVHFIHQEAQKSSHDETHDYLLIQCLRILSQDFPKPIPPVNWSCLHEIFHRSLEIRQFCVALAINQSAISGSAKRFLCNYLEGFEPSVSYQDEMSTVFGKISVLLDTVDTLFVKKYLERCFMFTFQEEERRKMLRSCFAKNTQLLKESQLVVIGEAFLEVFYASNDRKKMFEAFDAIYGNVDANHVDFVIRLASQLDVVLKRYICCRLAKKPGNIRLLDQIVSHISDPSTRFDSSVQWEDFQDLLKNLREIYDSHSDDNEVFIKFCLQILADIQFSMVSGYPKDFKNYCEIFYDLVENISGYSKIDSNCEDSDANGFAHALISLLEQKHWKDHCGQIYEFLIEFNETLEMDDDDRVKNAIIFSKDLPFFCNKSIWAKIMMMIKS